MVSNGGLAKAGSGALTLTGVNTYTGLTTLSAGTLALSSANALGAAAATLALNGGTVTSSSSTGYTLTAAGASTIGGDVTFGDGTNTGSLTFTNNFGFGSAARTLSVATGTTTTLSGVLSNTSGGLTKAGAGTLVLSGATTFTGNLTVSAGTLRITGSNSAAPGTVAVNSGGTLDLTGGQGIFRTLAFSGSTTHVNIAGGTVVVDKFEYGDNNDFNQLRNNYYSIALTSGGRIRHTANESFLRAVTVDVGGAVFETAAGVTVTKLAGSTASQNLTRFSANSSLTFAGAGTYIMQDSLAPASWGNTGFSIAKQDSGTLRLTGTNLYTGGTSVTGGTLEFASGALSATGAITVNGGTLRWLSGNTQDISSRLTLVPSGSAALDTNGNNVTLGTGIGGSTSSSLTKSGAGILALGAANSFAGGLAVNGGRVDVSALGSLGSGPVSIGSAGALRLSLTLPGASSLSTLFSNGLSGTGILDLNLSGENPLALGGYANFGGSVRVTSGVFDNSGFAGGIIFAGGRLLDPSSFTGTTTVSGPITDVSQLPTGGTLVLDAGGSIDFGQTPYTGTILYRGGAVSGSGFQGVLDVDAPSVAVSGSFGQGSLRVGAGRGVDLTGPTTGTILFDGGSITGGGNLTGRLQLGAGRSLVLGAGLDVLPNTVTLGVAAGTSVDLAWSATAATIDFTGGSIANAANFAGTIAVSQNAIFSTNGTVGGTVNLGSGTTLSGNGIFTGTVTAAAGATLSPGASPGLTSYQTLNLNGGSAVNLEFFSAFETVTIDGQSRRGYDSLLAETLNFGTAGEVGGGSILLRLATLTNWNDMVPDWNGTSGFLPAEGSSLIHGPLDGPKEFVIARFNTSDRLGMLTNGLNVTPWFTFDADLYRGTGASGFQVIANTGDTSAWELNMIAVPEPSACGLILGGVVVAAGLWRRRRATIR